MVGLVEDVEDDVHAVLEEELGDVVVQADEDGDGEDVVLDHRVVHLEVAEEGWEDLVVVHLQVVLFVVDDRLDVEDDVVDVLLLRDLGVEALQEVREALDGRKVGGKGKVRLREGAGRRFTGLDAVRHAAPAVPDVVDL